MPQAPQGEGEGEGQGSSFKRNGGIRVMKAGEPVPLIPGEPVPLANPCDHNLKPTAMFFQLSSEGQDDRV